jgi:hypothetical protein
MRTCFFLLTLSALPALAQTETNIACVERLEVPAYPVLAKQARIAGVLTTEVLVGPDASVEKISSQWDSQWAAGSKADSIFSSVVEKSLRASTFAKSCAGKKVTLVFNFVLAESLPPQQTRFSFGYPNRFWIAVPSPMVQP